MRSLGSILYDVLANYPRPHDPTFRSNCITDGDRMYELVEHRLPDYVETELKQRGIEDRFNISGSVGPGSYTYIPYVPIMHVQNTNTPNRGQYVVYLFDPAGDCLYLVLNQGTVELQERARETHYAPEEVARLRANALASDIRRPSGFHTGSIELETRGEEDRVYVSGAIFHREYMLDTFPEDEKITDDLANIVGAYKDWVEKDDVVSDFSI